MIGVDYGVRRVAVACPSQGWATALTLKPGADRGNELNELAQFVRGRVADMEGHIYIESAIGGMSGNIQTVVGMAETCGAIMACFPGRATRVAPSSWKAAVCGNGRLDKAGVSAWLEQHHPALAAACRLANGKLDQDRVDATCLGLYVPGVAGERPVRRSRSRAVLRVGPQAADEQG